MSIDTQRPRKWGVLILFLSLPTLLCCALPILLVSLGMGSVVAAIYGEQFPLLQWFTNNSLITFGISGGVLVISYWLLFRSGRACPADPELVIACAKAHYWNVRFLFIATVLWSIGAFTAFGLPFFI